MTQTQSNRVAVVDTNRISRVGGGAPVVDLYADHLRRASPVGSSDGQIYRPSSSGGHLSRAGGGAPTAALCAGHLRRATPMGSSGGLLYRPCCSGGHLLWDASVGSYCSGVARYSGGQLLRRSWFGRQLLWPAATVASRLRRTCYCCCCLLRRTCCCGFSALVYLRYCPLPKLAIQWIR